MANVLSIVMIQRLTLFVMETSEGTYREGCHCFLAALTLVTLAFTNEEKFYRQGCLLRYLRRNVLSRQAGVYYRRR